MNQDEKIKKMIKRTQQHIGELEARVDAVVSQSPKKDTWLSDYVLGKIKGNLEDDDLAELMYERLSQVELPEMKLELGEAKSRIESLTTENLYLPKQVYGVLLSYRDCLETCNPSVLTQYETVVAESRIKNTSLEMLSEGNRVKEEDALEAIRGIEAYISDLSENDRAKVRNAMRDASIDTGVGLTAGLPYAEKERIFASGRYRWERYRERIAEIDRELGISVTQN